MFELVFNSVLVEISKIIRVICSYLSFLLQLRLASYILSCWDSFQIALQSEIE